MFTKKRNSAKLVKIYLCFEDEGKELNDVFLMTYVVKTSRVKRCCSSYTSYTLAIRVDCCRCFQRSDIDSGKRYMLLWFIHVASGVFGFILISLEQVSRLVLRYCHRCIYSCFANETYTWQATSNTFLLNSTLSHFEVGITGKVQVLSGRRPTNYLFVCSICGNNGGFNRHLSNSIFPEYGLVKHLLLVRGACSFERRNSDFHLPSLAVEIRLKLRKFTATRHQEIT